MKTNLIEKTISHQLGECLEWIEETGGSIQEAAARYPESSQELISLLRASAYLQRSARISPSPEFKAAARTRLLNQIDALEKAPNAHIVTKSGTRRLIWQNNTGNRRFAMRLVLIIGIIASLVGGSSGAAYASSGALPGDWLYPVKTTIQDLALTFSDDVQDIDLLLEHMGENLREMEQLAHQERYADILIGLQEYEANLQALTRTRNRISYEDAGTEESINLRIQAQLQTHIQLLDQLKEQTRDQLQLQDQLQQAIQLTEQGNTYGPNEGGQPDEPGTPNGAGPGEPQPQNGPGKPEDAGPSSEPDPGQGSQKQNSSGGGDGSSDGSSNGEKDGNGGDQNQSGSGSGGSGSGQSGKP